MTWVRRARLDALERDVAQARADYADLLGRYHALVDRLYEMQRVGFRPPVVADPGPSLPDPLPRVVIDAVEARMDPAGPAGRETMRQAWRWLGEGMEPDDVAARILRGAEYQEA